MTPRTIPPPPTVLELMTENAQLRQQLTALALAPTVRYWAISVLSSRTVWFNAANLIVAVLSLTEVVTLIPMRYMPLQAAFMAVVNVWLRTVTVRPVALIAPGTTKAVEVEKIGPPAPIPVVSD